MLKKLIRSAEFPGILLVLCTAISLILANSPISSAYFSFWQLRIGGNHLMPFFQKSLLAWINDGLMVVFFLLVGLEIKKEVMLGELSTVRKAILPILAALGGMLAPACIFILLNTHTPTASGWGIPVATDIAFSLGVLAMAGSRVPKALKVFLCTLAIADDLGAILVIALFYSKGIAWMYLFAGLGVFCVLMLKSFIHTPFTSLRKRLMLGDQNLNSQSYLYRNLENLFYILVGILLWILIEHSGIHATIAGVLLACTIPIHPNPKESFTHQWISFLEKPVYYGILPMFALANTLILFSINQFVQLFSPLSIGIFLGLVIGKPLGIFGATYLSVKLRLAHLSSTLNWRQVLGMACLGGIGFTMSIFITLLAFSDLNFQNQAKLTILLASIISAWIGLVILRANQSEHRPHN